VRQGLEEAGGKTRTRRTETGYKADDRRVIWQWTETPDSHSDAALVNPAGTGGKDYVLPWEISKRV